MDRKNILLVCKESYAMPMHFLAQLLRGENVNLAAFFIMPHEALFNTSHYKFFKRKNKNITVYDMRETAKRYIDDVKGNRIELNNEYLAKIEKNYSSFKNINLQFMSSQFHSYNYHYRDYYYEVPYEIQLYWLQLYYQRVENIIDEFRPDIIYDSDNAELGRIVLLEVAHSRGIPYIALEHARFENYYIPTSTLGLEIFVPFREAFESLKTQYAHGNLNNLRGFKYLSDFRSKETILAEDYKKISTLFKKWNTLIEFYRTIKKSWTSFLWWWKTQKIRKGAVPLYTRYFKRIQGHWLRFLRNYILRRFEKKYFKRIDTKTMEYILFPLHLVPESTTFTKAPYFCTEIFLIESLAKSVPWNVKILVKEHWSMLGQRPLSFYKKLQKLPNVVLVNPFQYKDPKKYIQDCIGVVTITGTSALETAFLGKPSIIFGSTSFEVLSCVNRISDVTKISDIISRWMRGETDVYDYELVAYIEAVFLYGRNLSLKTLLHQDTETNNRGEDKKVREETLKLKEILDFGRIS